jgi:hypothetical protein
MEYVAVSKEFVVRLMQIGANFGDVSPFIPTAHATGFPMMS